MECPSSWPARRPNHLSSKHSQQFVNAAGRLRASNDRDLDCESDDPTPSPSASDSSPADGSSSNSAKLAASAAADTSSSSSSSSEQANAAADVGVQPTNWVAEYEQLAQARVKPQAGSGPDATSESVTDAGGTESSEEDKADEEAEDQLVQLVEGCFSSVFLGSLALLIASFLGKTPECGWAGLPDAPLGAGQACGTQKPA